MFLWVVSSLVLCEVVSLLSQACSSSSSSSSKRRRRRRQKQQQRHHLSPSPPQISIIFSRSLIICIMRPLLVAASALLLMLAPTCTASLAYVWNQQLPPRIQWMTNEGCVLTLRYPCLLVEPRCIICSRARISLCPFNSHCHCFSYCGEESEQVAGLRCCCISNRTRINCVV